MRQMIEVYQRLHCPIVAVERVSRKRTSDYGIVAARPAGDHLYQVTDLVEKPSPEEAPSDLAIIGRYILTPDVFKHLEATAAGRGGAVASRRDRRRAATPPRGGATRGGSARTRRDASWRPAAAPSWGVGRPVRAGPRSSCLRSSTCSSGPTPRRRSSVRRPWERASPSWTPRAATTWSRPPTATAAGSARPRS